MFSFVVGVKNLKLAFFREANVSEQSAGLPYSLIATSYDLCLAKVADANLCKLLFLMSNVMRV